MNGSVYKSEVRGVTGDFRLYTKLHSNYMIYALVLAVMQEYSWAGYFLVTSYVIMFGFMFSCIPQHHVIWLWLGCCFAWIFWQLFLLGC